LDFNMLKVFLSFLLFAFALQGEEDSTQFFCELTCEFFWWQLYGTFNIFKMLLV
jgi:hypothetical protein